MTESAEVRRGIQCAVYDGTYWGTTRGPGDGNTRAALMSPAQFAGRLDEIAKRWVFQVEQGGGKPTDTPVLPPEAAASATAAATAAAPPPATTEPGAPALPVSPGVQGGGTPPYHYQVRMSLRKKRRLPEVVQLLGRAGLRGMHVSVTAACNRDDWGYVQKLDTRAAGGVEKVGPWSSDGARPPPDGTEGGGGAGNGVEGPKREPRVLKGRTPWPWQQEIIDLAHQVKTDEATALRTMRDIFVVLDPVGQLGKTWLGKYMWYHGLGELLPIAKEGRTLMHGAYQFRHAHCFLLDLPREASTTSAATGKKTWLGDSRWIDVWGVVEQIKNGYVHDERHQMKRIIRDEPMVVVFCNRMPPLYALSRDRWVVKMVDHRRQLVDWTPEREKHITAYWTEMRRLEREEDNALHPQRHTRLECDSPIPVVRPTRTTTTTTTPTPTTTTTTTPGRAATTTAAVGGVIVPRAKRPRAQLGQAPPKRARIQPAT
jgi:hypothetical protein